MSRVNSHGARVKLAIIAAGLDLWRTDPASVSARKIGQRVGLTHSACLYHFGNIDCLKESIAYAAVELRDYIIVPQLIAIRHNAVAHLTAEERAEYLTYL